VFECAGSPAAARLAILAARPLGKVMLVGFATEPLDLIAAPILLKEVMLQGIVAYRREEFAAAIDLLASGAVPVERIVTGTAPLEDAEQAFRALTTPGTAQLKILLDPRAGQ
jgi:threonine dehydrogenase-like Zn-dependent dehydrogenase